MMTIPDDAFDIANRFLDSGQKRNELELAILRHMEHHIVLEREACAAIADAYNDPASEIAYGKDARAAASEIALAIRERGGL